MRGTLSGAQSGRGKERALGSGLLSPPYLREGLEHPQEQQSQRGAEGAHPGRPGAEGWVRSWRPPMRPGKRAAPTCGALLAQGRAWVDLRRRQTSLGAPRGTNRTLRSHFKSGRSEGSA